MSKFVIARSDGMGWAVIAKDLADTLNRESKQSAQTTRLGFLYATDDLAEDYPSILTFLRQKTGIEHWVGSLGYGVCSTGYECYGESAAVVMVGSFPDSAFEIVRTLDQDIAQLDPDTADWIAEKSPPFGIIHGDPSNAETAVLIEDLSLEMELLSKNYPGFLVGGLTASRNRPYQIADDITEGGISGVLFAPGCEVATGLTQGCSPLGEVHTVTDCVDNIIIGLDGESAMTVFRRDIGELLSRNLERVSGYIHTAFLVTGSDTGDYMARNLVGIDKDRGWLAVGAEVSPGDRVMFVRRDPESAIRDLVRMTTDLKNRLQDVPRGGIYFSCVSRGEAMFGENGREMGIIKEILGDVPIVGFFGQGEVSNNRLYSYAGVLALFM